MWNIFLISTTVVIYTQFGEGQDDGFLRLMDGSHSREGRLEIFHRGIWGSVCLDDFGIKDGRVACRQLGFRCVSYVQIYTESGHTSSTIWMAGVNCNGFESSLMQCSFRGWGRNNCISGHNVGIRCYGGCEGDLRLIKGSYYGRLEIYHIGSWGTICDDSFRYEDALAVCKQLRLGTTIVQYYTAGHGSGTIWLDEVACNGNENRIYNCKHRGWNVHDCSHSDDVGVRCAGSLAVNGNWGSWSFWTTCNSNCGSGTRKRTRRCNNPLPAFGGSSCIGNSEESHTCTGSSCPVRGNWGSWSAWTGCSSSCDSGYQTRHRVCNNPVPSSSGLYCNGRSFEVRNCNIAKCPVRGNWGSWSAWTGCSSSCDFGYQTRHRVCNNPVPSSSGLYCNGRSFEVRNCNIAKCPVDGSWGHWSILSKCSVTCGRGSQQRTRNCDNPTPSFGGSSCTGVDKLTYPCSQIHCPVDGDWSEWVVWNVCSSSCGSGVKTRTRQCNDPSPTYGGVRCIGKNINSNSCNTYECPVDGDWTKWSSWSNCTALCNGGIQERARTCSAPTPSNGGHYCKGTATESQPCNNAHCQINGQWGSWQEWDSCNITCGNGFQNRSRKCDNPFPMFGGSECVGFDFDIQNCSQDICPAAKRHGKEETSKLFSIGILGGVAAACIVVTVVIISIVLFVFRRFRCGQNGKRKKNGTNNNNGELRETARTNNYECIGPSDGIQNDAYDIYNITRSGHTNSTFNAGNEALYENLKI